MAASYNFRSAFNGFNREDVVHYIEYINSKHLSQVNQLRSDLTAIQQENAEYQEREVQCDPELDAKLEALSARVAELEAENTALQEAKVALEADLAAAREVQTQALRRNDDELEAYRRAERMERQARERTEAMYQKANGVLADATAKVDEATAQISGIADQVAAQLAVLQEAVTGSKSALTDAAATLYAIRPED